MKQVQKTIGRWVQRLVGKSHTGAQAQRVQQPAELDAKVLRQVGGGDGASSPYKGW